MFLTTCVAKEGVIKQLVRSTKYRTIKNLYQFIQSGRYAVAQDMF